MEGESGRWTSGVPEHAQPATSVRGVRGPGERYAFRLYCTNALGETFAARAGVPCAARRGVVHWQYRTFPEHPVDPMTHFTDADRRARLVRRHRLAARAAGPPAKGKFEVPAAGDADGSAAEATAVLEAVRSLVALHSTDPATPYLSVRARVSGVARADLEEALLGGRTLVRLHAMRRTLFVVPAADRAVFLEAVSRKIADRERKRLEKWVAAASGAPEGEGDRAREPAALRGRLERLEEAVLQVLRAEGERSTRELAERVPELKMELTVGSGRWVGRVPLSSRLLLLMAMEGRIVRAGWAGSWRSSQYRWAAADRWFAGGAAEVRRRSEDTDPDRKSEGAGPDWTPAGARAALAGRYLARFGPATLDDVRWWTGWTVGATRAALRAVDARAVALDGGGEGWVLPGDEAPSDGPADDRASGRARVFSRVALLPALDPTTMGWKERTWYLGGHADTLFDTNGNAGPTVWIDGRIVGGWAVRNGGEVVWRLLEEVDAEARDELRAAAADLTHWLEGEVVVPRFRTPLERELTNS